MKHFIWGLGSTLEIQGPYFIPILKSHFRSLIFSNVEISCFPWLLWFWISVCMKMVNWMCKQQATPAVVNVKWWEMFAKACSFLPSFLKIQDIYDFIVLFVQLAFLFLTFLKCYFFGHFILSETSLYSIACARFLLQLGKRSRGHS